MSTGMVAVNNTDLLIQPDVRWVPRANLSIDGMGHPVYSAIREVELSFELIDQATMNQLEGFYNLCGATGTVVVRLPPPYGPQFSFLDYSGCVLGEPEVGGNYYTEDGWTPSVKMLVANIRT